MVHGRSVRQILRLFNRIYNPEDYFYIHVDTRSQYLFDQLKHLENEQNVIVTENRFSPIWGGASLLHMMLNSMKEMLNLDWKFDFFINLSGTDYVMKHPKERLFAPNFKVFLTDFEKATGAIAPVDLC